MICWHIPGGPKKWYLLIYSQQFFVTTLLRHIAVMPSVFCFNGFNQAPYGISTTKLFWVNFKMLHI